MSLWTLVKRTFLGDDREEKAEAERELAALRRSATPEPSPPENALSEAPVPEPLGKVDPVVRKRESEERQRKFTEIKSKLSQAQDVLDTLRNGKRNGKAEPSTS